MRAQRDEQQKQLKIDGYGVAKNENICNNFSDVSDERILVPWQTATKFMMKHIWHILFMTDTHRTLIGWNNSAVLMCPNPYFNWEIKTDAAAIGTKALMLQFVKIFMKIS